MSIIKNFFPEDTRIAEFCSSVAMIFMSFLIFVHAPSIDLLQALTAIHRYEFWGFLAFTFGITQFISLVFYPKLDLLRCIMSLISGSALIWISISAINTDIELSDICTFSIGCTNLYAFVINSTQIRRV